jgi:hypothetical protein
MCRGVKWWEAGMTKIRRTGIYRLVYRPLGDSRDPERGEDWHDEARHDADRQTVSLAGLAVTLAVLVVCLFLVKQLSRAAAVDDCLLAGHNNCDLLLARLR